MVPSFVSVSGKRKPCAGACRVAASQLGPYDQLARVTSEPVDKDLRSVRSKASSTSEQATAPAEGPKGRRAGPRIASCCSSGDLAMPLFAPARSASACRGPLCLCLCLDSTVEMARDDAARGGLAQRRRDSLAAVHRE